MTPEQIKAKELVDKFTKILLKKELRAHGSFIKDCAKECALIAIDAIISQLEEMLEPENIFFWHVDKTGQTTDGYGLLDFYRSVKLEITNI